jgi:small basic protein (TIGR04137 family)
MITRNRPSVAKGGCGFFEGFWSMSIDKSLRRKSGMSGSRSVLTRAERIEALKADDKWTEGRSPFNLPKVRVMKLGKKTKKAAKTAEDAKDAKGAKPAAGGKK